MKIRRRPNRAKGSFSWQLDCGRIDGRHVRISFATKQEAETELAARLKGQRPRLDVIVDAHLKELRADVARLQKENARLEQENQTLKQQVKDAAVFPEELKPVAGLLRHQAVAREYAVYFLCRQGKVIYVGQARSVMRRISDHLDENCKDFDAVWWLPCESRELDRVEREWIHRLKPHANVRILPLKP